MSTVSLWDAHAHIQPPWYSQKEITALIEDCQKNAIEGFINNISNPVKADYERGLVLADKYAMVHTNFGLQPTEATDDNLRIFKEFATNYQEKICAIGEVGLDYYWVKDQNMLAKQEEVFRACIETANDLQLPLVIHSRKAETECLNILEKMANVPVVMHGIEASEEHTNRMIDLNYSITIPTSICIRKKYKKIATKMPLELILLETDSPFQLPFNPPAGQKVKNSPVNIHLSAKKLAEIKDLPFEDIARVTSTNTKTFFQIKD